MGSFRFVTGTGNNRRETYDLIEAYKNMERVSKSSTRSSSRSGSSRYQSKKTSQSSSVGTKLFNSLMADLQKKADKWAAETLAEFKGAVPVDTGNLRNSLAVTRRSVNKTDGKISITVGVDSNKILPPPARMRQRNGKMRTMPKYDYSPYVLGDSAPYGGTAWGVTDTIGRGRANIGGRSISSTFSSIAVKNAKKIF